MLALNYMHLQNVVDWDLKPDNIMCLDCTDEIWIKLTDFGFATFFDPKKKLDL